MQTKFSNMQLNNTNMMRSNAILRSCVHCGFCTATCPTYKVLGDELDSPRGRIYLIKDMLENNKIPDKTTVKHIDRCLSCLSCMTTCPSGVHYMHLIDHARHYIEKNYKRRLGDRLLRWSLAKVLPHPWRFRLSLKLAKIITPLRALIPDNKVKAMLDMVPKTLPKESKNDGPQVFKPLNGKKKRVALMTGCVQKVLNTDINDATIRLLQRLGCEVVIVDKIGCCGALSHHLGKVEESHAFAASNIRAFMREINGEGLDAIIINTSGCGTVVKDYGTIFTNHALEKDAKHIAALAKDITEFVWELLLNSEFSVNSEFPVKIGNKHKDLRVAYHAACSLQHGQQLLATPKDLLKKLGFQLVEPMDSHLCCGSAGTYNLLQPEISQKLQELKVKSLEATKADIICSGNIGCMMQIATKSQIPIVHSVELLDWALGGQKPHII